MVKTPSKERIPTKLRATLDSEDIPRFVNIQRTMNKPSYNATMKLLLDVFEETLTGKENNSAIKVAFAVKEFLTTLKDASPSLYGECMNILENEE